MDDLYSFVFRGLLAEASLDKNGRHKARHFRREDAIQLESSLRFEMLDQDLLAESRRMATVYCAIHTFENTVRLFVTKGMAEQHGELWWSQVPEPIQKKAEIRSSDEAKFKWHGTRGSSNIDYCDFGDLSKIIGAHWSIFEAVLANFEWAKQILGTLEKSRNIIMHGGQLAQEDIERIGMNIRDWIRQTG